MKNLIEGLAYTLENNIDTDQIIPAKHLIYDIGDPTEKKMYGRYALSGLPHNKRGLPQGDIDFVKKETSSSEFKIVIAGSNFGCGSSREHAPFALKEAGIEAVVAQSYSRLFFRNAVDGAFFPPFQYKDSALFQQIKTRDHLLINIEKNTLDNLTQKTKHSLLPIGDVLDILKAGGIFQYAKKNPSL